MLSHLKLLAQLQNKIRLGVVPLLLLLLLKRESTTIGSMEGFIVILKDDSEFLR